MPSINAQPSTLDGIKRLAKTIKRERGLSHHQALEEASRAAGFQNLRHAQNQIAHPTTHAVYLSAYWANATGAGRETLTIRLPKPLADVIARYQLRTAKNLGWFFLESVDHIELRMDVDDQQLARADLLAAARAALHGGDRFAADHDAAAEPSHAHFRRSTRAGPPFALDRQCDGRLGVCRRALCAP